MRIWIILKMNISPRAIRNYLFRVGVALDILFNVITGGHINQTFSARNYVWKKNGKPNLVLLIDLIIFWDKDHCMNSWLYWLTKSNRVRKVNKPNVEVVRRKDNEI